MTIISRKCKDLGLPPEEFRRFVSLFVDVTSGEMLRLEEALRKEDMERLRQTAHSIKGAALTMDFQEIASVARAIEMKGGAGDKGGIDTDIEVLRSHLVALQEALEQGSQWG